MALGDVIRGRLTMSQAECAAKIGVSLRTLERWLSGERPMPVTSLYDIAAVIGVPAAQLISEADAARLVDGYGLAASNPGTDPGTETDEGHTP
jgi:transcriptional regulator with XRE-family HTH domain